MAEIKIQAMKKKMMAKQLPLDVLLFNVFPRLPVKSVVRCMSVCKLWRSVLSTPNFAKMHLKSIKKDDYHQNHTKLLVGSSSTGHPFLPLYLNALDFEAHDGTCAFYKSPYEYEGYEAHNGIGVTWSLAFPFEASKGVSILASLDGLVCVVIISWIEMFSRRYSDLVLWNPLTGAYKKLPNFSSYGCMSYNDIDAYGLCYDSSGDDYKLLHVSSKKEDAQAHIFSLKSDLWRKVETDASSTRISDYVWSHGCFDNGTLYFTVEERQEKFTYSVICFDLKRDKFRSIPSPPVRFHCYRPSFMVVRGCIRLCYSYGYLDPEIELWRMDGNEKVVWVKTDTFPIQCDGYGYVIPLHVMRNRNLLVFNRTMNEVATVDPNKNKATKFILFNDSRKFWKLMTYTETLISPNL